MPIDRRLLTHLNWPLLALTVVLFGLGVLNLYSASGFRMEEGIAMSSYYRKQFIWGLIGLSGMITFLLFDYRHLRVLSLPIFVVTIALLVAVPLFGVKIYGAQRWLSFGLFNFQPSEVAKISILLIGAKMLSKGTEKLDFIPLGATLAVGMIPAALIISQPDLGSGLNLLLLLGGIILYRGLTGRVWKTALVVVPPIPFLGWEFIMRDYQKQRVLTFLNPGDDPLGAGYHIIQSQIAIGSGRLWGKGFLEGTQSQLRFLPEKHTDFALAVFGEEWGFAGAILLLGLFCLFLHAIFTTARDAKDRFGSFLAAGVFLQGGCRKARGAGRGSGPP